MISTGKGWYAIFVDELAATRMRHNQTQRQFNIEDYRSSGVGFVNSNRITLEERDWLGYRARQGYSRPKFVTILSEHDAQLRKQFLDFIILKDPAIYEFICKSLQMQNKDLNHRLKKKQLKMMKEEKTKLKKQNRVVSNPY